MLTYPSDSLPQIVCPMDEDAIPPNPFCSAPPHSEPPPPLFPISSITPSCANDDGLSGHRRSGRIQGIRGQTPKKQSSSSTDSGAAQKPSRQNPSPNKRQRHGANMVSQSKQPRAEDTYVQEKQNEDGFDFTFAAEHQNKQKERKSPRKKQRAPAAENVFEQVAADAAAVDGDDDAQNPDAPEPDVDGCGGLAVGHAVESASPPKGWVIGPLFQSFKSKMASFTEIVMSPVKLFRANSPPLTECELQHNGSAGDDDDDDDDDDDGDDDVEPSSVFRPVAPSENGNRESAEAHQQMLGNGEGAPYAKTDVLRYSKKLAFDVELTTCGGGSDLADECVVAHEEINSVPSRASPAPGSVSASEPAGSGSGSGSSASMPSGNSSASHDSASEISSAARERVRQAARPKPPPRKRTGNRSGLKKVVSEVRREESDPEVGDERLPQTNPVKPNKDDSSDAARTQPPLEDAGRLQPDGGGGDDNGKETESCSLVGQSLWSNAANGGTPSPTLDAEQLERRLNPDFCAAAALGRSKRGLKPSRHAQEPAKRKKLAGDTCAEETKGTRPQRKAAVLTDTTVEVEVATGETLKPPRKRQAGSKGANKKGKQETHVTINEAALNARTESSPDAMLVCSVDNSGGLTDENQRGGVNGKTKPSGSCKRLKTKTGVCKPDVNMESMDLETTVAITSAQQELPAPDALVRPDRRQLQTKCSGVNKKPAKRKSPNQASSAIESDASTLVPTSSAPSVEPSEHRPRTGGGGSLNQPSKRSKKAPRGAVKPCEPAGPQETDQCVANLHLVTKESQCKEGKGKTTTEPVYFEMTPFESHHQAAAPPPPQPRLDCFVQLNNKDIDEKLKPAAPVADGEAFPDAAAATDPSSIGVSRPRSSARRVNNKPRRADSQRRRCRVLHSRTRKGEEMTNSVTMEDADLGAAGARSSQSGFSRRLLRSYSCPEIPSLRGHDAPWTTTPTPTLTVHSPHHSRAQASHQHQSSHTPAVPHAHKSLRRARRHTVCSVEVEREIAPLCLRKEVYPSRRSAPYDGIAQHLSPSLALSPSTSLSALASCFLSSPLAFLSKKVEGRGAAAAAAATATAAATSSTLSHASSPSSSAFSTSPLGSSSWHLPGFLQRSDSSRAANNSSSSGNPLACEAERRRQSEEEEDEDEDTSSSSQEYEDVALREEKALSDSEIKVVQKHEERGKVSSIRIRKTLPKPQNNLTPMGLPKPIRLKKKEFSLEEIYTNKNFSKPPESRLETIFEVPLNRRNGSESWFGQRRVKRFLEFLEVGEARRPKKPLVGAGKVAGVLSSRTRRGGFAKDEPSLSAQEVDSLLCAKLDQLSLWLIDDQTDSLQMPLKVVLI